jgi:hypothetical protein
MRKSNTWTADEDDRFSRMVEDRTNPSDIARHLGRQLDGLKTRGHAIDLPLMVQVEAAATRVVDATLCSRNRPGVSNWSEVLKSEEFSPAPPLLGRVLSAVGARGRFFSRPPAL